MLLLMNIDFDITLAAERRKRSWLFCLVLETRIFANVRNFGNIVCALECQHAVYVPNAKGIFSYIPYNLEILCINVSVESRTFLIYAHQ